jgi:hypothetical protein
MGRPYGPDGNLVKKIADEQPPTRWLFCFSCDTFGDMNLIALLFFLVATAVVVALWEIQIEGRAGWAGNLPTRRWQNRWTKIFWGGRPLTGYHLGLLATLLTLVHLPILFVEW